MQRPGFPSHPRASLAYGDGREDTVADEHVQVRMEVGAEGAERAP